MTITEQIKALETEYLDEPILVEITQAATAPWTFCKVTDLIALAESHDRLLKAAKRYRGEVHDGTTAEDGKSLTEILDEAIKEAEKL